MSAITIVRAGLASTVQDPGRPGLADLGVPHSGWVDPDLACLVNRLAGNDPRVAVIETCGGLTIGAVGAVLVVDSMELAPRLLRDGEQHTLAGGHGQVWHYLAVRGGFDTPVVLGSRSTDTLSGLAGATLSDGVVLEIGNAPTTPITVDRAPNRQVPSRVRISAGPRLDWFAPRTLEGLCALSWTVTESSRIGVRLTGGAVCRRVTSELPSEGLIRGAIQALPDGNLVMMLADHPTTGGYPVAAVVHPDDVWIVAQTAAGRVVRLVM
jgi:biotin-dependent carboxylase-like uncharacterized protein